MFKKGETVYYGTAGVCVVSDICRSPFDKNDDRMYYVLAPKDFDNGLLEYPQYTRPPVWRDREVPEVLLSGHHANIEKWRRAQSEALTAQRRPDLMEEVEG